jgi:hypothetical protein
VLQKLIRKLLLDGLDRFLKWLVSLAIRKGAVHLSNDLIVSLGASLTESHASDYEFKFARGFKE